MAKFQQGSGNKIKVYACLLPLGSRVEPTDYSGITLGAAGAAGATTITVGAATKVIPGGTPIPFTTPTASTVVGFYGVAYVGPKDVPIGATSIEVLPLAVSDKTKAAGYSSFPSGATATIVAKNRVLGGTSTGLNNGGDRTTSIVFEDEGGYEDGLVTTATWDVPWTANLISEDIAYRHIQAAVNNAVTGREIFVWAEQAPPQGSLTQKGDEYKGACLVTNFSADFPSDGILTYSCTFTGQGSPAYTPTPL